MRSALIGAAGALSAAGVLVLALADGITAGVVATILLGVAGVLLVSLAFLVIGESEDRERRGGR